MKKAAIFLAAIALSVGAFAQTPPSKPIEWFNEQMTNNPSWSTQEGSQEEIIERNTGIRRNRTPLAPATLLLLGLGGAVVGTKVVRNKRK